VVVRVATSVAELDAVRTELLAGTVPRPHLAFVPTMGALHEGHLSLVRLARGVADLVVMSIFVNPLQFGPNEDYARYPRTLDVDLARAEEAGVDVVFTPSVADIYPAGRQVSVNAGPIGDLLEGASRPGHFDGVLTVVLKLLNIVRPDIAVFGRKDAQQLACIRRMALDLNLETAIVGAPIIREPDGLAMSSRNRFLSPAERSSALVLNASLRAAEAATSPTESLAAADRVLAGAIEAGEIELDYVTVVNAATMLAVPADHTGPALAMIAARVGSTRLIDNVELIYPEPETPADPDAHPPAVLRPVAD
jgi:pantoate--beta-alanine ligase